MKVELEKIFVVNLDDKIHRWKLFENLKKDKIQRVRAVDSRKNWYKYRDYDLALLPYGKSTDHYFTQSKGAVGCYLSHYTIWDTIIKNDIEWSLVLEDDADINSVEKYISNNCIVDVNTDADVVQLNDRTQHGDLVTYFNGTTSYLINLRGAKILYEATHDFSHFTEELNDVLQWRVDKLNLHSCPEYLYDTIPKKHCWASPNAIRLPVDKFIGFNGHDSIPKEKRIKLEFNPQISIHPSLIESDVTDPNQTYYWDMDCQQLEKLEKRDDYKWWENQPSGLSKKRDFVDEPSESSLILLCVLRDEELQLPYFINYYEKLGVTHFVFIDNGSIDESQRFLCNHEFKNIQVYHTNDSYADNLYGVNWVNQLLNNQFKNKWCLVVDTDELLMLRNNIKLPELRKKMIKSNSSILVTCLVDFYPLQLNKKEYEVNKPFLSHSNYFDEMDSERIFAQVQNDGVITVKGGLRQRLYGESEKANNESVCLTKKTFFKYDFYETHYLSEGYHWLKPNEFIDWMHHKNNELWKSQNKFLKFYNDILILAHFKYLKPNIFKYFKERVRRNQDWDGGKNVKNKSVEYQNYVDHNTFDIYSNMISKGFISTKNLYDLTLNKLKNIQKKKF